MVLIHISKSTEEFLFESSTTAAVEDVTRAIASLHNLRLRVRRLAGGVRLLAQFGPMKLESDRGLSDSQINALGTEQKADPAADPLGIREGRPPIAQLQATLNQVAQAAEDAISNVHAKLRRPLSVALILEALQNIKGAVMMAYPQGLPEWDSVQRGIDDTEELSGTEDSKHVLDPSTAALWFAGKCLDRELTLSKYIGSNEKVIIKARIENKGGSAPQREPAVDEDTRRKMMSLWHKKEQEAARMEEQSEDSYLNASWANPKGFKQSAMGMGEIKFKQGGGGAGGR